MDFYIKTDRSGNLVIKEEETMSRDKLMGFTIGIVCCVLILLAAFFSVVAWNQYQSIQKERTEYCQELGYDTYSAGKCHTLSIIYTQNLRIDESKEATIKNKVVTTSYVDNW